MRQRIQQLIAIMSVAGGLAAAPALAADINVGIHVNTPPPPVVVAPVPSVVLTPPSITFAAPPPLVIVPGTPTVQYVSSGPHNVFVFGGRYYSIHNGSWFHAGHYNGPWKHIKTEKVPAPVIGVPVAYYRVPPGHARKHDEGGAAAVGHCPPGQAKKGRC